MSAYYVLSRGYSDEQSKLLSYEACLHSSLGGVRHADKQIITINVQRIVILRKGQDGH